MDADASGCFICSKHLQGEHVHSFVFGDRVPHLHVHLAPRFPGAPDELRGLGAVGIQRSKLVPRGGLDDIRRMCDLLRDATT